MPRLLQSNHNLMKQEKQEKKDKKKQEKHIKQENRQSNNEKILLYLEIIRLYIIMVVIYDCLERKTDNISKCHMNSFSYFEISACL